MDKAQLKKHKCKIIKAAKEDAAEYVEGKRNTLSLDLQRRVVRSINRQLKTPRITPRMPRLR